MTRRLTPIQCCAIMALALLIFLAPATAMAKTPEPHIIHFSPNQTALKAADKERLRHLLGGYRPESGEKILVVGYSDSSGDTARNLRLSERRAQAVRHAIVSMLDEGAHQVVALGRGEANPVADNHRKEGRTQNRRVEVFLARAVDAPLAVGKQHETVRLDRDVVAPLVRDALALLRRQRLPEALQLLHRAREHGAEQYGGWHTAYGIAGYYAAHDPDTARAHLVKALQSDPFDELARDFLGRMEAREKVAQGEITSEMGRRAETPIAVLTPSQAHEYLSLFQVRPHGRRRLADRPVDAWQCRDLHGQPVTYYFDHARVHTWAFEQPGGVHPTVPPKPSAAAAQPLPASDFKPPAVGSPAVNALAMPSGVWDSKLFR